MAVTTDALIIFGLIVVCGLAVAFAKGVFKPLYQASAPHKMHLGAIVDGVSRTVGTTLIGNSFMFPQPTREAGHVHALVVPIKSLKGSKLRLRWRIEAAPGVEFRAQEAIDSLGSISLMVQRKGDDYRPKGKKAFYRLYAPVETVQPLAAGDHEMIVNLDGIGWNGVNAGSIGTSATWADMVKNVEFLHICFGQLNGPRSHGVFATGEARFTFIALDRI